MATDPILRFQRWFTKARRVKIPLCEAMALATADRRARPSNRFVLLKQADQRGFVFYTNALSRKGIELRRNPYASLVVYWDKTGKQVRVEGRIVPVSAKDADEYWLTRPRGSRLGALASRQSAPLISRSLLLARFRKFRRQFKGKDIPRPYWWTGYCLVPSSIEFWSRRQYRLNHCELFLRTRRGWRRHFIQP